MTIAYWVLAGLLAAVFLFAGFTKLTRTTERLQAMGMGWTEDFSPAAVKGIAAAELLGAVGLIVPPLTGIAPVLAPLAAVGLAVTMIGAAVVHGRRSEPIVPTVILAAQALAAAVVGAAVWL